MSCLNTSEHLFNNGRKLIKQIEIIDIQYDHARAKKNYPVLLIELLNILWKGSSTLYRRIKRKEIQPISRLHDP
jgi:hypothetical protein